MYKTNLIKNDFIVFIFYNKTNFLIHSLFLSYLTVNFNFRSLSISFLDLYKRTFGEGFFYIRGLFIIFFIDAAITDDEPL